MKKVISILVAAILCATAFMTAFADSVEIEFGDIAGKKGDVNVDTYINSGDMVELTKILLDEAKEQSKKTADVNGDNTLDVRDLVRLKKNLADLEALYFAQGTTTVAGSESDKTTWMYTMNESGLAVREVDIDLGTGDKEISIAHLSDFHLVASGAKDLEDAQLKASYESRKNSFSNQLRNAQKAMDFAAFADKTVITGDVTDYLSFAALDQLKEVIGKSNATVTVGNHEFRKVWYGSYEDTVDETLRYNTLQENWPYNNVFYHSEVIKGKVMIIAMNNGAVKHQYQQYYPNAFTYNGKTATMDQFLAEDIAAAKANGYAVLIFQHCPISTGKSNETAVKAINKPTQTADLYTKYVGGTFLTHSSVDNNIYKTITENASIIKGLFSGHEHGHYYSEVKAKSTPDAADYDTVIPQYLLTCNAYDNGSAIKITVKY